ncbi:hypothetical protein BH09PSE6_BH09PSE6_03770 [soil metagenome]
MRQAPDGRVWISNSEFRSLHVVNPVAPYAEVRIPDPGVSSIYSIAFDHQGALWINVLGEGIYRADPTQLGSGVKRMSDGFPAPFTSVDGLTSNHRAFLLVDRDGDIWAGTNAGLDRFRRGDVVPVSMSTLFSNFSLVAGKSGELWVGSTATSPLLVTADVIAGRRLPTPVPDDIAGTIVAPESVSSVYVDPRGTAWWGDSYGGVWRQEGKHFERMAQRPSQLTHDHIWDITQGGPDDRFWISFGDEPIQKVDKGVLVPLDRPAGMLSRGASASWHEGPGRTWMGHTENRVQHIVGSTVTSFGEADGLDIGRIRVIRGDGRLVWFGGELGLALFDGTRFHHIAVQDAPPLQTVSGLVAASNGDLWLAELSGIVRISADEVQALASNPTRAVRIRRFDHLDGLRGAVQMNWTSSVAVEADDHRLWFATDDGLAMIDPARLQPVSKAAPVVIRSLFANDVRYGARSGINLPIGTRNVRLDFTALSLAIPERALYRYQLEGFEQTWHTTSATNRIASYTRVPPGPYRFRIETADGDGRFGEQSSTLDFVIEAAFWETRSFALMGSGP